MPNLLTPQQQSDYERDGFLVLPNFISNESCDTLINRATQLIEAFIPPQQKTTFSTHDQRHAKHQYFLDSSDKIHFFFEEKGTNEKGELTTDKLHCINKIGHALHDLDPQFNTFSRDKKIAALIQDLDIQDPLLVQSMYICKQPFIGGEVNCHQDATYFYMKEAPVTGLWFALEDATLENGCLWAIPGGHRTPLKSRMKRLENNEILFETYDDTPWDLNKMVALPVTKGSLIILHGLLPHMSYENTSAKSRHAYTLHVVSNQLEYPKDNWLQRTKNLPFKGFQL